MSKKVEAQYEDIKNKTTPTLEAMPLIVSASTPPLAIKKRAASTI